MKSKLSNLWRWDGTIGRGEYLGWGVALFAHAIHRPGPDPGNQLSERSAA